MNTITIILAESGRIADLKKDFPLYQYAFQNKLLNVLIPTSILTPKLLSQYIDSDGIVKADNGAYTAVKIGAIYTKRDGKLDTSQPYYMRYMKNVMYNNVEYALYERYMPKEFTIFVGQGENAQTLTINVVNILATVTIQENDDGTISKTINEPKTLSYITTQTCRLDVMQSDELDKDEDVSPTDWELLEAQVNDLTEKIPNKSNRNETVLKYDVSSILPVDIIYNKNGIKTQGVYFYNETFDIPTPSGETISEDGTIFVFKTRESEDKSILYQDEVFNFSNGIVQRTLTLSSSDLSLIVASDWTIPNKDWLDGLGNSIGLNSLHFNPNDGKLTYSEELATFDGIFVYTTIDNPDQEIKAKGSISFKIKALDNVILDSDETNSALEIHLDKAFINRITTLESSKASQSDLDETNENLEQIRRVQASDSLAIVGLQSDVLTIKDTIEDLRTSGGGITEIPSASKETLGGIRLWIEGDTLYISTVKAPQYNNPVVDGALKVEGAYTVEQTDGTLKLG